jgi:hypothetical protein
MIPVNGVSLCHAACLATRLRCVSPRVQRGAPPLSPAGQTPASVYRPSPRESLRRLLFLATPREGYDAGLDEIDDGVRSIDCCQVLIARFDERNHINRS